MDEIKKWLESEDKNYDAGLMLLAKYGRNRILLSNLSKRETKHFRDKLEYELRKIAKLPAGKIQLDDSKPKPVVPTFIVFHDLTGEFIACGVENGDVCISSENLPDLESAIQTALKSDQEKTPVQLKIIEPAAQLKFTYQDLPENLKLVYNQNMEAYSEIKALHAQMAFRPEGEEFNLQRKELAEAICALDDKIAANWKLIDESLAGKNMPVKAVTDKKPKTKLEIDALPDGEEKFNAKALRIKSNRTWIGRNLPKIETSEGDAKAKLQAEYEIRLKELEEWGEKI